MKKTSIILALLLTSVMLQATYHYQWLTTLGDKGRDEVSSVAVMNDGETIVCGSYNLVVRDTLFPMGQATANRNGFIFKADTEGKEVWRYTFSGPGTDYLGAVATQNSTIVVAGSFSDSVTYRGNARVAKGDNLFIAWLNGDGQLLRWKLLEGKAGNNIQKLRFSETGDLVLAGYFFGELTLDDQTIHSVGNSDLFFARIDSAGNTKMFSTLGSSGRDMVSDFSLMDDGTLFTSVVVKSDLKQGTNIIASYQSNPDNEVAAIVPLFINREGIASASSVLASGEGMEARAVTTVDSMFFIAMQTRGNCTIDGDTIQGCGGRDAFVVALNSSGNRMWTKRIAGTGGDWVNALDGFGSELLCTGVTYGALILGYDTIPDRSGDGKVFVARMDPLVGRFIDAESLEGMGENYPVSTVVDEHGNIVIGGNFRGQLTLRGKTSLSQGQEDAFVCRIANCAMRKVRIESSPYHCVGAETPLKVKPGYLYYLWNGEAFGDTIYTATKAGWYSVIVKDSIGCELEDSVLLTERPLPQPYLGVDVMLRPQDSLVLSPGVFARYVWDNGSMDATLTLSGNLLYNNTQSFRVEVADTFGCVNADTILVSKADTNASLMLSDISIYPQVTKSGIFIKNTGQLQYNLMIRGFVSNSHALSFERAMHIVPGQTIWYNLSDVPTGSYVVTVTDGIRMVTEPIIKQQP